MIARGSLTLRLAAVNVALLAMVLMVVTAIEYHVARKQIDLTFDERLVSAGSMLRSLMDEELDAMPRGSRGMGALISDEDRKALTSEFGRHLAFNVWYEGRLSEQGRGISFDPPSADGFRGEDVNGERWRIYSTIDPAAGVAISVAEPVRERQEVIWRAVRDMVVPGLLLLPGMLIAMWAVAVHAMSRIRQFADQLARRSPDDLSLIGEAGWPAELLPLVAGTNGLLTRLGAAFDMERRVVDLAAHQLRTPLASMRIQVQSARRASDRNELDRILARLEATLLQGSGLTDRLLALARLEAHAPETQSGDLRPELERAVLEVLPIAEAKGQSINVDAVTTAPVALDAASCRLVCSCLLENAVKYSPGHSVITVGLSNDAGTIELTIADQGPGIPEAERDRVLERFSRGHTATGTAGSGLGLSIATAGARRAGGWLRLETAMGGTGLMVRLVFPQAASHETLAA